MATELPRMAPPADSCVALFTFFLPPDALVDGRDLRGKSVVDVGTESGILALAAARAGAANVTATDINPNAALTAAENARTNGLGDRVAPYAPTSSRVFLKRAGRGRNRQWPVIITGQTLGRCTARCGRIFVLEASRPWVSRVEISAKSPRSQHRFPISDQWLFTYARADSSGMHFKSS